MNKLALMLSVLFWGLVFIASKDILHYMGPNTLSFLRCALGLVCILPLAARNGFRLKSLKNKDYVLYGLIGCAGHYLLLNRAVALCTPGMSALLQAMIPVYGILLGHFLLKERLNKSKVTGAILSICGIAAASWQAIVEEEGSSLWGILLMVAAVFLWSLYTAISKKREGKTDSLVLTAALFSYGLLFMAPFTAYELAAENGTGIPVIVNAKMISELAFIGICATAATVALWNYALKTIDSGVASVALNFIPVIGIVGAALLGESAAPSQWLGCGMVLAGVLMAASAELRPGGRNSSG